MKNRTNKRRIYELYRSRYIPLNAPRNKRYKLEDLLAKMPGKLPMGEGWDEMAPVAVGREFGSKDYERLAKLDALANAAKVAADAMKANRSSTIDQATFSEMRKRGRR